MSPRDRLDERYHNDATFHTVVDQLSKLIEDMQLSPSEVREAAMYAVYRSECRRPGFIGAISELAREPKEGGPYR
ncbi:MAG: hypothetical protein K0S65_976 [Labilithrix sp.]|nr:hypothetical protein [Labilithrix sp.]